MPSKTQIRMFFSPIAILSLIAPFSVANVALADNTSVTCYFQKGNEKTWQWGLNSSSNWYKLDGTWEKKDGITSFVTNTSRSEIIQSCRKSQDYYNRKSYKLVGIYAANSSVGKNYLIYAKGKRV